MILLINIDCARSDAAVLARVAEFSPEARWTRIHRAYQRGSSSLTCYEGRVEGLEDLSFGEKDLFYSRGYFLYLIKNIRWWNGALAGEVEE